MKMRSEPSLGSIPPILIHLTDDLNRLASISREGILEARKAYGALYNHPELQESQRVVCLSEVGLADLVALADRHGDFGLGFHRRWSQRQGAAPVWYLPRQSEVQRRLFEIVRSLAFRDDPVMNHILWEFTPFIDYPKESEPDGRPSNYDWRWEREWRVRGDLAFEPGDVAILFAPEAFHDDVHGMWRSEALAAMPGRRPPVVDPRWPVDRQHSVIRRGSVAVSGVVDKGSQPRGDELELVIEPFDEGDVIETAPSPLTWVEDEAMELRERQEEWADWLMEMERDDI